jgi:hypothetical protein
MNIDHSCHFLFLFGCVTYVMSELYETILIAMLPRTLTPGDGKHARAQQCVLTLSRYQLGLLSESDPRNAWFCTMNLRRPKIESQYMVHHIMYASLLTMFMIIKQHRTKNYSTGHKNWSHSGKTDVYQQTLGAMLLVVVLCSYDIWL